MNSEMHHLATMWSIIASKVGCLTSTSYLNTTFWDVHPLFLLVQSGETAQLKKRLILQLESFPAGRITKDARKQLEYLTVSLVNTFMIAAIQGGVYPPEANAIADHALHRLSQLKSVTEIRTEDIAAAVGLSPYHLSRLFKTHTGLTMREFLTKERIDAAKQILATTDRTIPQIASLLRFCDQSYFTLVFRKQTGQTPGEYRQENRR